MHDFGRNAPREREAMSGEKISVVIARACGRSSIPETSMMEPRGRGVLDTRMRGYDEVGGGMTRWG
jgi:hypothetical protein